MTAPAGQKTMPAPMVTYAQTASARDHFHMQFSGGPVVPMICRKRTGQGKFFPMMRFITDFADQADILPVVVTVGCLMGLRGWWRGMRVWCTTVVLTLGTMLLLKVAGLYYAWFMQAEVISPSGHVAAACVTYGGLLVMLLRRWLIRYPVTMLVPLLGVAMVIGSSRWWLQAHTMGEIVIGTLVGCTAGLVLGMECGPVPRSLWRYLLPGVVCIALLFHGLHLGAEETIRQVFSPQELFPNHL